MQDSATPAVDWDAIREEYEARRYPPAMICKRHGVTAAQLRHRRQTQGWLNYRGRPLPHGELVIRMLKILEKQVRQLEMAKDEPIEKQVSALSVQVRTLDKLIELGAAKPNVEPTSKKDIAELRSKLAKRIEQFRNR